MNPYEQIVMLIASLYGQLTEAQAKVAKLEAEKDDQRSLSVD